jgi:uncharacterized protein
VHIDTVLVKVVSRCNLDCSYCYVYHMGDEAWRVLPKRLTRQTEFAIVEQLAALLKSQGRPFSIVLHGGEPLQFGCSRLATFLENLRSTLGKTCGISIQTNGVLISEAILDICSANGVSISVSLDGPANIHNQFRLDSRRRATHQRVLAGIEKLKRHPHAAQLFSGALAVVDPYSSPADVYAFFKELGVPSVDFLYRDGNHTVLPYGKASPTSIEYGRWMSALLDLYVSDPAPFRIRVLDDLMKLILGGAGTKEGIGLTDFGILVIETDGSIKKNDTLKSSPLGDRFNGTRNISEQSLVDIVGSAEFEEYHNSQRPTSSKCCDCQILRVCGGGMLTHRFKDGSGYDNPSVFCSDQIFLIERMRSLLSHDSRVSDVAA